MAKRETSRCFFGLLPTRCATSGLLCWSRRWSTEFTGTTVGKRDALQTRLQNVLESHRGLLADFDNRPLIKFNLDSDFDSQTVN